MIEIFLIIAIAISIVVTSRSKNRAEPNYIEYDVDRNIRLRKSKMTDSLEEDNNGIS